MKKTKTQKHNPIEKDKKRSFTQRFKSYPIRVSITSIFLSLIIINILVISLYNYISSSRALIDLSEDLLSQVNSNVIEKTTHYFEPVLTVLEQTAYLVEQKIISIDSHFYMQIYGTQILELYPQIAMINIGDEAGNFFMLKRLPDNRLGTKIIEKNESPPVQWIYRDSQGNIESIEEFETIEYDPRGRPWYVGAKENNAIFWSRIYTFFTDKQLGITIGTPIYQPSGAFWGVMSLDITLEDLSNFFGNLHIGENGIAFIINKDNQVIAYHDPSKIIMERNGEITPVNADEIQVPMIQSAFNAYSQQQKINFIYEYQGKDYLSTFTPFPSSFGQDWTIGVVVPEDDFIGVIKENNLYVFIISMVILIISIVLIAIVAKSISNPIQILANEANKVKNFDLEGDIVIHSRIKEVQILTRSILSMENGLRSFEKYVPSQLVRTLIQKGQQAIIGGNKRLITTMFSDIENFSTLSESMQPEELMILISNYFEDLTKIIKEQEGTIDKYIGDSIMAFWGAPLEDESHAYHACLAAWLCNQSILEQDKKDAKHDKSAFPTRFGIHTGEAVVGNIGSSDRMNYSAIGDNVNVASRLEGVNKVYGTRIIISEATYELVKKDFVFRPLDAITVKGKTKGTKIYELLCTEKCPQASEYRKLSKDFNQAYQLYLKRRWKAALDLLYSIQEDFPEDYPIQLYIERCTQYRKKSPPSDWDGVWRMTTK